MQLPLSQNQQRLWFEFQLAPDSTAYNNSFHFLLAGHLDTMVLSSCIKELTRNTQALRTRFTQNKHEPIQIIDDDISINVEFIDLAEKVGAEKESIKNQILTDFDNTHINIKQLPLFRYQIIRLDEASHIVSFLWHHIVIDGVSIHLFLDKLSSLYNQTINNEVSIVQDESCSIKEIIEYEKRLLNDEEIIKRQTYWRDRLKSSNFNIELPTSQSGKKGETIGSNAGKRIYSKIDRTLTNKIVALTRETKTSMFIMMTAAFNLLLYRYSGVVDQVIGCTVDKRTTFNRNYIGFLVNTLPFRTCIRNDMTFFELLTEVKRNRKNDKQYQDTPLSLVVSSMRDQKTSTATDLFNISLSEITYASFNLNLTGLKCSPIPVIDAKINSDLILHYDKSDEILLEFHYNKDKFSDDFIHGFIESFHCILKDVSTNPSKALYQVSVLTEDATSRILKLSNNIVDNSRADSSTLLHHLFERQCDKTPNNVAVVDEGHSYTYQELNNKSGKIAKIIRQEYQRDRGTTLSADTIIGLYAERSVDLIAGMLGILKAGAAFLPMDTSYPVDRLAYMLADSGCGFILTQTHLLENAQAISKKDAKLVCFDCDSDIIKQDDVKFENKINAQNLAYVIYTSGSTGKPKGIQIEHHSIVNHMLWMAKSYPIDQRDCVLQKTPISFDASIWDFILPLMTGATLVMARVGGHRDPYYLVDTIKKYQISVIQFVPTMLEMFLNIVEKTGKFDEIVSLRYVFCGGENFERRVAEKFKLMHQAKLVNLYGPTEATITTTHHNITDEEHNQQIDHVPIGVPVDNASCYVLDDALQLVPNYVVGELYIGGVGLTPGYLNNIDLTDACFLVNPYNSNNDDRNKRIYKTGDLVYRNDQGYLVFVGRSDSQIKVRGVRVELSEIETILLDHPDVEHAVVVFRGTSETKQLIAFVKLIQDSKINDDVKLRNYLDEKLPSYYMPDYIVFIPEFPVSPSGKLDREKLSEYKIEQEKVTIASPRNSTEFQILNIFKRILKRNNIGIYDNFFNLGGNSLLAIELVLTINTELNSALSISDVFHCADTEQIAALINKDTLESRQYSPLFTLQGNSSDKHIICIHPAGGTAFCYLSLADSLGSSYIVYGIQSPGVEINDYKVLSLEHTAKEYVRLIIEKGIQSPYCLLGWSLGGVIAFEIASQMKVAGLEVANLFLLDSSPPTPLALSSVTETPRDEFIKKLVRFNGVYPGINDEAINRYHSIYNGLTMSLKSYHPKLVDCNTVLIKAGGQTNLKAESEWSHYVSGSLSIECVDSDHWSFMNYPDVHEIASIINKYN